ncbi:Fic family protein [Granulicella sp. dw_53]|uniref:Fic family protein n=1 Tax=Granulicella sp. dw_53 TaxID=2719792 RepID=UPI001BD6930E|nr:Fic family protein [Granulicella sp. dw_53]
MATKKSGFRPAFRITPTIARDLMRIEAMKHAIEALPITPRMLANLRETARLFSTHYSTMIEGNLLTQEEVTQVIAEDHHFPGRERDEREVRGYYAALDEVERLAQRPSEFTEKSAQSLHALVMGGGKTRSRPTPYRDGQNVIKDSKTRSIVYMPPEAKDVPALMAELIAWINVEDDLPVPLKAAIAHYQYATVHPYYDGNGRTARLLTTLILHMGGYGLKGLYALEEYYARDLKAYYGALTVGPSHNYYMGRAIADITGWIAYFIEGMATSFEHVQTQASREAQAGAGDRSQLLRRLDARQRRVLVLFQRSREVTAKEIAELFGFHPRTAAALCQRWVAERFLIVSDASRKARRYRPVDEIEAHIGDL